MCKLSCSNSVQLFYEIDETVSTGYLFKSLMPEGKKDFLNLEVLHFTLLYLRPEGRSVSTLSHTPTLYLRVVFIFKLNRHGMESTGLWDIKGSEGYIYAAFKIQSEEGTSGDRK